jgi:hypothetical protein
MSPDGGPFQEPDEQQLLLIVDAENSNRIGHEKPAKKIFVYKRPIWWPWGAMTGCPRMRCLVCSWLVPGLARRRSAEHQGGAV